MLCLSKIGMKYNIAQNNYLSKNISFTVSLKHQTYLTFVWISKILNIRYNYTDTCCNNIYMYFGSYYFYLSICELWDQRYLFIYSDKSI